MDRVKRADKESNVNESCFHLSINISSGLRKLRKKEFGFLMCFLLGTEQHSMICSSLLARNAKLSILHDIVKGDEKWV